MEYFVKAALLRFEVHIHANQAVLKFFKQGMLLIRFKKGCLN